VVFELADIVEERTHLQDAVPVTRNNYAQAKKLFAAEKKKPEYGKVFGQPINAKMDEVLKKNCIDQATMFGQTIKGNGARKLMANAPAIINKIEEHVLDAPTNFAMLAKPIKNYSVRLMGTSVA
jgi:hypothetical protein